MVSKSIFNVSRFQKCKHKVPPPSLLKKCFFSQNLPWETKGKNLSFFFEKNYFQFFSRFFFHYISFQSQVGLFQKNSKKFLKKILRKSIGYPKVGFSLKKPTLRKAESHCSRTSQVTMSYIFKKFNKFLKKKMRMTMVWNNVIIIKIGVQKRHFILWNSPISVLQVGRCHFDMVKTQCLK